MTIEAKCSGCGRTLRVEDKDAGKKVGCPVCGASTEMPSLTDAEPQIWRMQTPEGQVYGPIGRSELDSWVDSGRVDVECQLSDDNKIWRSAAEIYPALAPVPSPTVADVVAAAPVQVVPPSLIGYLQPHRGSLIVTMGVLAWVTCPIFSVFAWVMGASDIQDMKHGRMDPGGLQQTQAGMVLGMVNVILWMVAGVISVFVVVFVVAAR